MDAAGLPGGAVEPSLGLVVSEAASRASEGDGDELVARLRAGDAAAIRAVYQQHHAPVRAFASRLLGDAAAAEDLVHEVFVALPDAVRKFRGDCALRSFLIAVAANRSRHAIRAAARRRAAMSRLAAEPAGAPPSTPDGHAERTELAAALQRALDALPDDQRIAFVLCEVEERSARDVAQIVGAPEATVRTRVFNAKKKLRARLGEEGVR